jgi:hypothetical protein
MPNFVFWRDHRLISLGSLGRQKNQALSETVFGLNSECGGKKNSYRVEFYSDNPDLACIPSMKKQYFQVLGETEKSIVSQPKDDQVYGPKSTIIVSWDKNTFPATAKLRLSLRKIYSADAYDEILLLENQNNDGLAEFSASEALSQDSTRDLLDMISSNYCFVVICFNERESRSIGIFALIDPLELPNFGPRPDD